VPELQYLLVLDGGEQIRSENWPQAPGLQTVAFRRPAASGTASATSGLWNPAFELTLELTLPRIEDFRYRRPYVAVWIEDAEHMPIRTVALWSEKPRYLSDLRQWYRDNEMLPDGVDIWRTLSSATRPPGSYSLTWDGKDNGGKLVKTGKYTVCIEAAREHGGYDIQRQELSFDNNNPQQMTLPAARELGAVTLDYRKH
jgi:hypothetical protein